MSTPPLIARQPVYDARHHVLAWDIAHARAQRPVATPPADPDPEASEVAHFELLTGALLVVGLERLIGHGFGFLPVSAHTLLSPTLRLLPPLQVVLTLPAAGLRSVDLQTRLAPLQRAGYRDPRVVLRRFAEPAIAWAVSVGNLLTKDKEKRNPEERVRIVHAMRMAQRIVRQRFGSFRACYEAGLRSNPNLQGRVSVRFVIASDGRVSTSVNSSSKGCELNNCMPEFVPICVSRWYGGPRHNSPDSTKLVSMTMRRIRRLMRHALCAARPAPPSLLH